MTIEPAEQDAGIPPEVAKRTAELMRRTSAEAGQADAKASILLAGILAVVGGVSALLSTARWNPVSQPVWLQVCWWVAVVGLAVALVALCGAVYPRGHRREPDRRVIGYFGDVVRYDSPAALAVALREAANERATAVDQLWQLSVVVDAKYRLVRTAVRGLVLAVVLLLVVLVVALGWLR